MGRRVRCILCLVAVGIAGCASESERQAHRQWAAAETAPVTIGGASYPRKSAPELREDPALTDYLVYAAQNNPGLDAALHRWKAALERIPQARGMPDPDVMYEYENENVESRNTEQTHRFGVSQKFPWYGKLGLRGDMATQAALSEQQKYEAERLKLFFKVKKAYYEYYYLGRAVAVTEENIELLSAIEKVVRTRYKTAGAEHADLIRMQVELGKMENEARSMRDMQNPVVAVLNAAMDRPVDKPLPWPKDIPEEKTTFTEEEVQTWLVQSSPELKALDFMVAEEKAAIAMARREYYPDPVLGLKYMFMRTTDPGESMNENGIMVSLGFGVPVWYEKYNAAVREARARYRAAQKMRREMENSLGSEVKMALFGFRDANRKINLYKDTLVPKAEESLRATQQAFLAGKAGFTDLLDAQRILLEFQLSHARARADRAQKLAELEMLVGREVGAPGPAEKVKPDVPAAPEAPGKDKEPRP